MALALLDFQTYLYYNPLALPVCGVTWFAIHSKKVFKVKDKTKNIVLVLSGILLGIVYFARLLLGIIP